jgi:hypothetical protein
MKLWQLICENMNSTRPIPEGETRRDFLKQAALTATGLAVSTPSWLSAGAAPARAAGKLPWYRRTLRWGQTNITEIDPARYDIAWWRERPHGCGSQRQTSPESS